MSQRTEQFLGTVDVRHLHEFDWPIVRLLNRSFVERLELQRFKRRLLTSHEYDRIRAVPHRDGEGNVSTHTFELYGVPGPDAAESATGTEWCREGCPRESPSTQLATET